MLCLKKVYRDELLQIAILLSLLRVDRNGPHRFDGHDAAAIGVGYDVIHESPPRGGSGDIRIHPKNLDSLLINQEQLVFDELNSLGRYNRISALHQDVTAYLLNLDGGGVVEEEVEVEEEEEMAAASNHTLLVAASTAWAPPCQTGALGGQEDAAHPSCSSSLPKHGGGGGSIGDEDLTQEDMALIENLWSQDVDLEAVAVVEPDTPDTEIGCSKKSPFFGAIKPCTGDEEDALEMRVKQEVKDEEMTDGGEEEGEEEGDEGVELMPWVGAEVGDLASLQHEEFFVKNEPGESETPPALGSASPLAPLIEEPDFSLAEALDLVGLDEDTFNFADSRDREELFTERRWSGGEPSRNSSSSSSSSSSIEEGGGGGGESGHDKGGEAEDEAEEEEKKEEKEEETDTGFASPSSEEEEEEEDLDELSDLLFGMIQAPAPHFHHGRSFQGRMPYVRTMSMEQRWQDLASLLSLPDPNHPYHHHYHHHHHHAGGGVGGGGPAYPAYPPHPHAHAAAAAAAVAAESARNSSAALLPPAAADGVHLNGTSSYPTTLGSNGNFGSAVATSMNLTNSSEPIATVSEATGGGSFKMENHESLYYSPICPSDSGNNTSELNHTTDGFLSSILNDEDIQLMDMAMNEGMYTMRMLEGGGGVVAASGGGVVGGAERGGGADSDSAVSSMGSERVPSLSSDTEWMETNSDSGHTPADHYHTSEHYHSSKYRWYDYSYPTRQHQSSQSSSDGGVGSASSRIHPVAQKKHHMYGKRFFQEQGMRTPMEHVAHNHTYHLPPEQPGAMQSRPMSRDKLRGKKAEDEHLSRDEKRARALNVPITVSDIINLPMDEFNERLSKYDLSESQLSLIRDIRRRGKNKVAAQNCRKRKLDQIMSLADEVKEMRDRKQRLLRDHDFLIAERQRVKSKFSQLYRHIFQALRDADGNPYSPYEWSLQQAADGSVMLVPRSSSGSTMLEPSPVPPPASSNSNSSNEQQSSDHHRHHHHHNHHHPDPRKPPQS